jgi:hypothetical protein
MNMKLIAVFIFVLILGKTSAQNFLPLPKNAQPGKGYVQCLIPDSIYTKEKNIGAIPPMGWEEFLLEKVPKHQGWTLELPVFDTVLIKIPIDQTTRMANLPDEYSLIYEEIKIEEFTFKWVLVNRNKECLSANPADCLSVIFVERVPEYERVQKRVLRATAHQQRYDNVDTIIFKQVIETKPLLKTAYEIPPQYKSIKSL